MQLVGPFVAMVTVVSKRLPGDSEKHPVFKIKVTHQVHTNHLDLTDTTSVFSIVVNQ